MNPIGPAPGIVQRADALQLARNLCAELCRNERNALDIAYQLGRVLDQLKKNTHHGDWGAVLAEIGIKQQHANECMRIGTLDGHTITKLRSIRAAVQYLRDKDAANRAGREPPALSNYEEITGAPVICRGDCEPESGEDRNTSKQQLHDGDERADHQQDAAGRGDRSRKAGGGSTGGKSSESSASSRPAPAAEQRTLLDHAGDDQTTATRRRKVATLQALAKKGAALCDDINDVIGQMDEAAPADEVRQRARDADVPLQDREQSLPPNSGRRFQQTTAERAYSPHVEKLKGVFLAIASEASEE